VTLKPGDSIPRQVDLGGVLGLPTVTAGRSLQRPDEEARMEEASGRCPVAHDELGALLKLETTALANKDDYFGRLREQGPVVYIPDLDVYAITRYDDITKVVLDTAVFSSAMDFRGPLVHQRFRAAHDNLCESSTEFRELEAQLEPDWRYERVFLASDPPKHTVQRRLIRGLFTPRRVEKIRARAQAIADELIDEVAGDETVDLIQKFAVKLPLRVIAEQLDVGIDRLADFKRWSDLFIVPIGNDDVNDEEVLEITRAALEFDQYFRPALAERRANPQDDFLTLIAQADDPEVSITEETRLAMVAALLAAGNETSTDLIGSSIELLTEYPDVAADLSANPQDIPKFVDEVLRLEAPSQGNFRKTTRDAVIAGVPIPAGSIIFLIWAAANRDASAFAEPEKLRLDRSNGTNHLAFGRGIHLCAGAALARMESQVAVETLLRRAYPWTILSKRMVRSYLLNGPHHLEVRFDNAVRSATTTV
jgi:cytochrome P450